MKEKKNKTEGCSYSNYLVQYALALVCILLFNICTLNTIAI